MTPEFRISLEYGSNRYMVEVWDGGRIVATIHAEPYGIRIESRRRMDVEVAKDGKEAYIRLVRVV